MIGYLSSQGSSAATRHPALAAAFKDCGRALCDVALFSAMVNILMLAGPLYMLQVYDRVLSSQSVATLIALSILLAGALALQALMDLIRNRMVTRSAACLDQHLAGVVHMAVIQLAAGGRSTSDTPDPVRELDQLRSFLTGQGPLAIVDLPWIPVFLLICGLIHPWLGIIASLGGTLLASATLLTEWASRGPSRDANLRARARSLTLELDRRNAETTTAMRMQAALSGRWLTLNAIYLRAMQRAADVVGLYGCLSRTARLMLQSAALGVGAYLVIQHELMPGAMIAASIMMTRALAPIETAIANWRGFVAARDSVGRLKRALEPLGADPVKTSLPKPHATLTTVGLTIVPPQGNAATVADVNFTVTAGQVLGVIGPSGSGKTSLARALVGVWRPAQGSVRIDGAALEQLPEHVLGPALGYLPQSVDLFDGSVSENIARMIEKPANEAVVGAAQAAGAHDMILRLPDGYDTRIGHAGAILSAGQRQRVALARALYGNPFVLVLDEPNSNLDGEGELALLQAIEAVKMRGGIVVLIAHRAGMLSVCDKLLVLRDGAQYAFGKPADILGRVARQLPDSTTTRLKVVASDGEKVQ
jgi:ATP-binding cassette, subfamily C, type I secretion system permease/ATPase